MASKKKETKKATTKATKKATTKATKKAATPDEHLARFESEIGIVDDGGAAEVATAVKDAQAAGAQLGDAELKTIELGAYIARLERAAVALGLRTADTLKLKRAKARQLGVTYNAGLNERVVAYIQDHTLKCGLAAAGAIIGGMAAGWLGALVGLVIGWLAGEVSERSERVPDYVRRTKEYFQQKKEDAPVTA